MCISFDSPAGEIPLRTSAPLALGVAGHYASVRMPPRKPARASAAALVAAIRKYCRENEQPDKANKWARYFAEGYDSWGLLDKDHPIFTTQQQAWAEEYAALGLDGFIEAGCELFKSGKYEEGSLSIRFVKTSKEEIDEARLAAIAGWFDGGVRNWAHVDVMCMELLWPLIESGKLKPSAFASWRTSPHRFQRRAAAVAMLGLLKTKGGPKKVLAFVEPMMEDQEKVVHQGLGWVIKEVWKLEPAMAEEFLLKWKDRSARRVITTACEKMTAEKKANFKASKKQT
jgi:3-methyladenine DNA glycosylase AlkD